MSDWYKGKDCYTSGCSDCYSKSAGYSISNDVYTIPSQPKYYDNRRENDYSRC